MILPLDIEKKEFTRDKRGYNSREVDEFLDLISVDYEKLLSDNRNMAHKIKFLEKQLEESQKADNAMLDTLETAKRLMGDISASAERRAELMMRDAELEAENMMIEAKTSIKKLNDEHQTLSNKVVRLRANLKKMLEDELASLEADDADLLSALDRSDIPEIEKEFGNYVPQEEPKKERDTLVVKEEEPAAEEAPEEAEIEVAAEVTEEVNDGPATVADLSDSLRKMAEETPRIDDTIILR